MCCPGLLCFSQKTKDIAHFDCCILFHSKSTLSQLARHGQTHLDDRDPDQAPQRSTGMPAKSRSARGSSGSILTTTDCAQGHVVTLELTSGQVYRGKLLEGAKSPRAHMFAACAWQMYSPKCVRTRLTLKLSSRGQHERPTQGHHSHGPRRPSVASRPGLHPRQPRPILHRPRYVAKRAHVPNPRHEGPWCRSGKRKSDGKSG